MVFGDWGLGIGPNPQSPIPNPQSPIPNPQLNLFREKPYNIFFLFKNLNIFLKLFKFILNKSFISFFRLDFNNEESFQKYYLIFWIS